MRSFTLVLVMIASPLVALAQAPPPDEPMPQPAAPPPPPEPQQQQTQPQPIEPTPMVPVPSPPPGYTPPDYTLPPGPAPTAARVIVTPEMAERWQHARVAYGVGSVTGLLGSGLTLSSVLVVAFTGYPCDPGDPAHALNPNDTCNPNNPNYRPARPTDAAPLLAYLGSSVSALGFIISASALGYEHHLLHELSSDPGRGLFGTGTAFGLIGFVGVGASYFFGLTNYLNPHDQGIAILATSISGTGLCLLGGILYSIDSGRMKRVWDRLGTF
jgi:hypothetical protein